MNFYEKALFVKAAVAATVSECNGLCPSRYASIRTFDEPTLLGGSVHTMRSVLIRALLRRCNLPSGLCSCRMGQVHVRSHLIRSEAIGPAVRVRHFLGSSLPLCQLPSPPLRSFTVSSCLPLSRLLLLLAPLGVVEWLIDLRRYPQTVQKHT